MILEIIGWIGAVGFAICGVPLAWKSYKDGHSEGQPYGFLYLWSTGEVCTFLYVLLKEPLLPVLANLVFNGMCLSVILYYKHRPRVDTKDEHEDGSVG